MNRKWLAALLLISGCAWEQTTTTTTGGPMTLDSQLTHHVAVLATQYGERNLQKPEALEHAATYIELTLRSAGYTPTAQTYRVEKKPVRNIIVEIPGASKPQEIVVLGAHYDSARGSPAANDNGSGVAAVLEIARKFANKPRGRTVRFVFFVNEEAPYSFTPQMGSEVYAHACRVDRENIVAMISAETLGYYTDQPKSQKFPPGLEGAGPRVGNYVAVVGNTESGALVMAATEAFQKASDFPCHSLVAKGKIPGIGYSDHHSFWEEGYPGIMFTDTANYRYPHYHKATDTADKIDYAKLAQVTQGIGAVVETLATVK